MDKFEVLAQYFGHSAFREGQAELIDAVLAGRDVLGIMPTGAGKSMCYQVPALLLSGLTLVISPLISLMKDQVDALEQAGVPAACLHSGLSPEEYSAAFRRAAQGQCKLLYVAPERLLTEEFLIFASRTEIAMLTVDEAHCVSQWGQDFRPSYLKILAFLERLDRRPVLSAFTATATATVRDDIQRLLELRDPLVVTTGFNRPNLYFGVEQPKDKFRALLAFLYENQGKSGIVYCATRKNVEEICAKLRERGYAAARYHAGLSDEERRAGQEDFLYDRVQVMVATNAFGMGIDKSNVSFVVHYNMPKNLESYYQEAGRAGRDGEPAQCLILYGKQDVRTNQFLIQNGDPNEALSDEQREAVRKQELERLRAMTYYCTGRRCLRAELLRYFGEKPAGYCGNCSCCCGNYETVDITLPAQKIVSCVYRLLQRNLRLGKVAIVEILHGSKTERISRLQLDTLSTYGLLSDMPTERIREILEHLIREEVLMLTDTEYPTVEFTMTSAALLRDRPPMTMQLPKEEKPVQPKVKIGDETVNPLLFEALKSLRTKIAAEERVPAYVVFADAALRDMCGKMPRDDEAFLHVAGVGARKAEKYGARFLGVIAQYA